jgi:hypothetical protein
MKRFEPKEQDGGTRLSLLMEPSAEGRWVRHEEASAEIERLRAYLTEIAKRIPGQGHEGVGVLARKALHTGDPASFYTRQ